MIASITSKYETLLYYFAYLLIVTNQDVVNIALIGDY